MRLEVVLLEAKEVAIDHAGCATRHSFDHRDAKTFAGRSNHEHARSITESGNLGGTAPGMRTHGPLRIGRAENTLIVHVGPDLAKIFGIVRAAYQVQRKTIAGIYFLLVVADQLQRVLLGSYPADAENKIFRLPVLVKNSGIAGTTQPKNVGMRSLTEMSNHAFEAGIRNSCLRVPLKKAEARSAFRQRYDDVIVVEIEGRIDKIREFKLFTQERTDKVRKWHRRAVVQELCLKIIPIKKMMHIVVVKNVFLVISNQSFKSAYYHRIRTIAAYHQHFSLHGLGYLSP